MGVSRPGCVFQIISSDIYIGGYKWLPLYTLLTYDIINCSGGSNRILESVIFMHFVGLLYSRGICFIVRKIFGNMAALSQAPSNSDPASATPSALLPDRARNALLGAFVADAACMGTHWVYGADAQRAAVGDAEAPEFTEPPVWKYYSPEKNPGHYASGAPSPYGEQLLFVARHCASQGIVDGADVSRAMHTWAEGYTGYVDHATQAFLQNMSKPDGSGQWPNSGADDNQAHCYMKVVPVTLMYAGKPEFADKVAECIRVHQNNPVAIAYGVAAARILEAVLLGASLTDALSTASAAVQARKQEPPENAAVGEKFVRAAASVSSGISLADLSKQVSNEIKKDTPDSPFYNIAATSCAWPGSFIVPLHQMYSASNGSREGESDTFVRVIRENIMLGGDTCSRAVLLGAIVAAVYGGVPDAWVGKLEGGFVSEIRMLANSLIMHNQANKN